MINVIGMCILSNMASLVYGKIGCFGLTVVSDGFIRVTQDLKNEQARKYICTAHTYYRKYEVKCKNK